ncbi:hypothetical protein BDW22DRAFT_1334794 [Trametopsis cervina]|nr:hypothetical protein BDW22DRAFT_1334794 [Trametopsis cervina]
MNYVHSHPEVLRTVFVQRIIGKGPLPPLYPKFKKAELEVSRGNSKEPFANDRKYLWVATHIAWSGWGNVMQDMVMIAQLTYAANRTFVFDDYAWDPDPNPPAYSKWNGKLIPSRIPLSALISGPMVGGPWPQGETADLSISKTRFDEICPEPYYIRAEWVNEIHGPGASAQKVIDTWAEYLAKIDRPCVEIARGSGMMIPPFIFGVKEELLPVWPTLSHSPVLTMFGWSTLAQSAFKTNRHLLLPESQHSPSESGPPCPECDYHYYELTGLLAMHVRRGDFLGHCESLGHWSASFNAFNEFDIFPDPWVAPQGSEDERMDVYRRRCKPTIEQIVEKVEQVRGSDAGKELKSVYVMTNGDKEWLEELKRALWARYPGWERIATSRDMKLTLEEKYVAQAADMYIGERAQVFIGNGFSSLTSNVAMLRVSKGFPGGATTMF